MPPHAWVQNQALSVYKSLPYILLFFGITGSRGRGAPFSSPQMLGWWCRYGV